MRLRDFEAMVREMAAGVPEEFLEGIAEIAVSSRTVPHPSREGIYTLGECVPVPGTDDRPDSLQSRVVLYHGSFAAVARDHPEFDWREEAWETLAHEVRHHVEWRARAPDLEALDAAAEHNYARHDGEPFDPGFYRDGERVAPGVFRVEDDYFIEVDRRAAETGAVPLVWAGREYRASLAEPLGPGPAFLTVEGLADPPPGEVVLVVPAARSWRVLLARPAVTEGAVRAVPAARSEQQ